MCVLCVFWHLNIRFTFVKSLLRQLLFLHEEVLLAVIILSVPIDPIDICHNMGVEGETCQSFL